MPCSGRLSGGVWPMTVRAMRNGSVSRRNKPFERTCRPPTLPKNPYLLIHPRNPLSAQTKKPLQRTSRVRFLPAPPFRTMAYHPSVAYPQGPFSDEAALIFRTPRRSIRFHPQHRGRTGPTGGRTFIQPPANLQIPRSTNKQPNGGHNQNSS